MAALLRISLWMAHFVSPLWARRIAGFLGRINYRLDLEATKVTRINLRTCFPNMEPAEIETMVRRRMHLVPLLFFEFSQLAHWPLDRLLGQILEVNAEELLTDAYQDSRGVLLLVPHFGNWEILCAFLGAHYSVAALYDRPKVTGLESVIVAARERYDGEMYPIDTGGMRSIFKTLKAGRLVAILPDQVPDRNGGIHVDFFGQPALTMTLSHKLIQRSRPRVLMGSVRRVFHRSNGYGYALDFFELPDEVQSEDAETSLRVMNTAIEQVVKTDPVQYQWEYKRFKRPPELGQTSIYRRQ
ncbi:MAG: lysophospholipid acyltransferase family protein [Pseudomonadota bacterium]